MPLEPQKQGQTPDLEAFLRAGLVPGKELGVCKPRVPETRVRFSRELDKAVLRAKLLLEQKVSRVELWALSQGQIQRLWTSSRPNAGSLQSESLELAGTVGRRDGGLR